jgi:chromosome segregation ATPase
MSGLLSQAVANLVGATQQISALSGLPPQAQQIQVATSRAISPLVAHIKSMQQAGSSFSQTVLPQLNDIETMVSNEQPVPAIKARMAAVLGEAQTLQSTVEQVSGQINSASSLIFGYFNQLAAIESELTTQMSALQGALGNAESEEDAAKKKYYYLIALGPFGLIGLSVALGLFLKWRSDVNGYESQISSLNAQINALTGLKSACQHMGTDFQAVITKNSGVRNSTDFLTSSIMNINNDVSTGTNHTVLGIMVRAAITEVTTLGVDMS